MVLAHRVWSELVALPSLQQGNHKMAEPWEGMLCFLLHMTGPLSFCQERSFVAWDHSFNTNFGHSRGEESTNNPAARIDWSVRNAGAQSATCLSVALSRS